MNVQRYINVLKNAPKYDIQAAEEDEFKDKEKFEDEKKRISK